MAAFAGQPLGAAEWLDRWPGPVAHAGHWLAGLLYLTPVILLAAAVLWQRIRDRSRR